MIHCYQLGGYHIVIDVYSGSIHSVDEVAYDVIQLFETHSEEEIVAQMRQKYAHRPDVTEAEILDCLSDIRELKAQRKLFTEDPYESLQGAMKHRPKVIKALCLHVAHTCNLNCSYCFASQGKYHGERAVMSEEVGRRALDFLVAHSGTRTNLEVDFFGGEPLVNWDVVKKVVAYGRSIEKEKGKNFRFTLTTNGMLVDDEVIEFANREMHNVVMSIDGRPQIHDFYRKDYSGKGSYDVVVPKFQKFAQSRGDTGYYVRGTYTHRNVDFTNDLFHLADLGFTQLSMEPVVCKPDDPEALTEEDFPELCRQYELLAMEMIRRKKQGRPLTFYHYMIDLAHGPCIYKRITGCGSGTEYLAVTPWGDLYPCHQFVGDEAYRLGNLWDGITNEVVQDEFRKCNVYARPDCDHCWARLYCSGGCAANAYHATGKITGTYEYGCRLFRKRMECAIMMQVAEAEEKAETEV